mmetsp:Transcript_7181/g.9115  ORF Transcript_7181/g.9115 Transcript_7181/m.9115 type:complete len:158 (-) Transcript_7181:474-947(-)
MTKLFATLFAVFMTSIQAFVVMNKVPTSTTLFLKDSIADMIDNTLARQQHKQEIDNALQERTKKVLDNKLPQDFDFALSDVSDDEGIMVQRKDKKMAHDDPKKYCADRCVSTGNCDVFEDMFHLSPKEVMAFCTDCVLSEDEESCDVPDAMLDGLSP